MMDSKFKIYKSGRTLRKAKLMDTNAHELRDGICVDPYSSKSGLSVRQQAPAHASYRIVIRVMSPTRGSPKICRMDLQSAEKRCGNCILRGFEVELVAPGVTSPQAPKRTCATNLHNQKKRDFTRGLKSIANTMCNPNLQPILVRMGSLA